MNTVEKYKNINAIHQELLDEHTRINNKLIEINTLYMNKQMTYKEYCKLRKRLLKSLRKINNKIIRHAGKLMDWHRKAYT